MDAIGATPTAASAASTSAIVDGEPRHVDESTIVQSVARTTRASSREGGGGGELSFWSTATYALHFYST